MSTVNKVICSKNSKFAHTLKLLLVLTVFLSSVRAQHVFEKLNGDSIKLPSWEERKIKDFIDSLKTKTVDEVVYDEILTYDEPGVVPELPVLKVFDGDELKEGQQITAVCVSRNGNPPAEIVWFLGDEKIEISLEFEEETKDETVSSVISVIQRNVTAEDDQKNLVCQTWHPGYSTNFAEAKQKLNVYFEPIQQPTKVISGLEIGDSVDVSLLFRSNPKPLSLIWIVGDRKVYYGAKASKYISREISAVGDNKWSATLHIINLTHHDTLLNYTLRVKNALGGADYHLRFDAQNDDMTVTEFETTTADDSNVEITTIENNEILNENESEVNQVDGPNENDKNGGSDSESDSILGDKEKVNYAEEIEITTGVYGIDGDIKLIENEKVLEDNGEEKIEENADFFEENQGNSEVASSMRDQKNQKRLTSKENLERLLKFEELIEVKLEESTILDDEKEENSSKEDGEYFSNFEEKMEDFEQETTQSFNSEETREKLQKNFYNYTNVHLENLEKSINLQEMYGNSGKFKDFQVNFKKTENFRNYSGKTDNLENKMNENQGISKNFQENLRKSENFHENPENLKELEEFNGKIGKTLHYHENQQDIENPKEVFQENSGNSANLENKINENLGKSINHQQNVENPTKLGEKFDENFGKTVRFQENLEKSENFQENPGKSERFQENPGKSESYQDNLEKQEIFQENDEKFKNLEDKISENQSKSENLHQNFQKSTTSQEKIDKNLENSSNSDEKLTLNLNKTSENNTKIEKSTLKTVQSQYRLNVKSTPIIDNRKFPARSYPSFLRNSTKSIKTFPTIKRSSTKSSRNFSSISRSPTKSLRNYSTYLRKSTKSARNFSPMHRSFTKPHKNNATNLKFPSKIHQTSQFSEFSTNFSQQLNTSSLKPLETTPSLISNTSNLTEPKVKVQKVLVYKRPIFKNHSESTTEAMVTISRSKDHETFLATVESTFVEVTAKAIIFWKTSLMIVIILVLIASLYYYRRRIIRLKAEIIQKNLGNSYNQSCSSPQSSNAYTPTYFPRRREISDKYSNVLDSDYDLSTRSRSNYYSQTYNPASHHSYETIDDQSNEHIYAEIGARKASITSNDSETKPNNYENNAVTIHVDYDHLDYSQSLETKAWHYYQPLLIRVSEEEKQPHEMESTYI